MAENISYEIAQRILPDNVKPIGTETVSVDDAFGRIAAEDICAVCDLPAFDRSPYDGYAFIAEDSAGADGLSGVTLRITEEIPAGCVPTIRLSHGMAAKVLTGAPIPENADAVCKFEETDYTAETVTLKRFYKCGENIVRKGEDITRGTVICSVGSRIDAGAAGLMASQNIVSAAVYKVPVIGIISTGSELIEAGEGMDPQQAATEGKIFNSNRYILAGAIRDIGCIPEYIGSAKDGIEDISELIALGLEKCDALVLTGGVSVGDYDFTDKAMRKAGVEVLFHGVDIKPGMACAYGIYEGKPVCALSGNPASALTNFALIAYPAIRKLCGFAECMPPLIRVKLVDKVAKVSEKTRILRGRLSLESGCVTMNVPKGQGNVVLSSAVGCNVYAIVPKGAGPLSEGTVLDGFEFPVR